MIKIHIIRHYRWKTTHPWSILTHWMLICSSRLVISPSTKESRIKVHDSCGISVRSVEGKLFILILIFLKRWLMSGSKQNFTHTHTQFLITMCRGLSLSHDGKQNKLKRLETCIIVKGLVSCPRVFVSGFLEIICSITPLSFASQEYSPSFTYFLLCSLFI